MTHTYAILHVSHRTYQEIRECLSHAGYEDQFYVDREWGEVIDMHGIALAACDGQEFRGWRETSKVLPPHAEPVLMRDDEGAIFVGRFEGDAWLTDPESVIFTMDEVTHWMPLPDQPEEE